MATSFDRWEKDPFFSAAEEVQDSADRMETVYRTWAHSRKEDLKLWSSEELCRDLRTAMGTTKWQLEEFEHAVETSYVTHSCDDARERHQEFIIAIQDHVSRIQNSLSEFDVINGKTLPSTWVRLDEGECNELASFLSGPPSSVDHVVLRDHKQDAVKDEDNFKKSCSNRLSEPSNSPEQGSLDNKEKFLGHRRTASACADIGSWKIDISEKDLAIASSDEVAQLPPRKNPSLSVIFDSVELTSAFKWPKNGTRKWKVSDINEQTDASQLKHSQFARGMDSCYEKGKSCLDGCDEYYDKQLYGWHGALHRQLQRSQYLMQYNRPVQVTLFLILSLTVLAAFRTLL